jgi:hypothetical protein
MKKLGMICAVAIVLAVFASAQMQMPKPGPEHKKLEIFAGSWTLEGESKPGPMGPGGKITETETCEWMEGGFYLVCHVKFTSVTMGNGSGLSVLGYSSDDKTYTYREFNSDGEFVDAKGAWDGDSIAWTSDNKMGGMTMKGRFTMKNISATSYNFSFEMSQDGTKWTTFMDGKAIKKK